MNENEFLACELTVKKVLHGLDELEYLTLLLVMLSISAIVFMPLFFALDIFLLSLPCLFFSTLLSTFYASKRLHKYIEGKEERFLYKQFGKTLVKFELLPAAIHPTHIIHK